jgi:transcriptional regulator with XRE-family HTH domain
MEQAGLTRQKTAADIGVTQRKESQEERLRAELAALPPTATNADRIAVVSRYGNPDVILRTLQASEDRQAALEQRRATAGLAAAQREDTRTQKQMREDEKRQDRLDKQAQSANAAIAGADRIIQEVGEAKEKVSGFTAGLGSYLSVLPLTEAKDLSKRLTTIKANLGFDRLQQMRDASPTGGALGQVAVQELIALQSTIASLDQDQSPAQLKQALDKIETSYARWRDTVRQAGKATVGGQPTGSNEIDFNSLPKRK